MASSKDEGNLIRLRRRGLRNHKNRKPLGRTIQGPAEVSEGSPRWPRGAHQQRGKKETTWEVTAAIQVRETVIHPSTGSFKNTYLVLLWAGQCSRPRGYSSEQNKVPILKGHTYK